MAALLLHDRSRLWSVLGLIAYMLGLMVFTTDWMLALDPTYPAGRLRLMSACRPTATS